MILKSACVAAVMAAATMGSVSIAFAEGEPVSSMAPMTIARVIAYGQENHDPLALITAVRMLNDLGANVAIPSTDPGTTGDQSQPVFDPVALLEEAEGYAAGDAELTSMIDKEMDNVESSRYVCYWEYSCDAWGWCDYYEICY